MIKTLILKNRSYRRFHEAQPLTRATLVELVDLARCTPSAANRQPLKYFLSSTPERNGRIFPCLQWAGYLKDWQGPAAGERPTGYIVILGDTTISKNFDCDLGIAAQTILLGAVAGGLGGCIIASVDREELRQACSIPAHLEILLVLALGRPQEEVVLEEAAEEGDIRYWRDEKAVHHVPKRRLAELIID
ncbi:MAG TPA: nitroreductase [Firmicutes bacterium]|nr:nitroreductase [Bacillota bacterium]HBR34457.1 nitroreductase [Bacillota bacterium]